jgi:hypothetical protein
VKKRQVSYCDQTYTVRAHKPCNDFRCYLGATYYEHNSGLGRASTAPMAPLSVTGSVVSSARYVTAIPMFLSARDIAAAAGSQPVCLLRDLNRGSLKALVERHREREVTQMDNTVWCHLYRILYHQRREQWQASGSIHLILLRLHNFIPPPKSRYPCTVHRLVDPPHSSPATFAWICMLHRSACTKRRRVRRMCVVIDTPPNSLEARSENAQYASILGLDAG